MAVVRSKVMVSLLVFAPRTELTYMTAEDSSQEMCCPNLGMFP